MRVYIASSWRNIERHREVVKAVREAGHEVYDFTDPENGKPFAWPQVTDLDCTQISGPQVVEVLDDPRSVKGFQSDMTALVKADAVILVMPCGRSAHLELGYAVGASKITIVLLTERQEAELMWSMVTVIAMDVEAAVAALSPPFPAFQRAAHHARLLATQAHNRMEDRGDHIGEQWRIATTHPTWRDRLTRRANAYRGSHPTQSDTAVREAVLAGLDLPHCDMGCGRRLPDSEVRLGIATCEHCAHGRCFSDGEVAP